MSKPAKSSSHRWSFYRAGGVDQVRLDTGADVLSLAQLDQKLWVALSCPTKGLETDERMLEMIDSDGDGQVRPKEILATVAWLGEVLRSADALAEGEDGVSLANLRTDTEAGKAVLASARHMLQAIGKAGDVVTVDDAVAAISKFAEARRNGDGVVMPEQVDDAAARAVAAEIVACTGGAPDRSGGVGCGKDQVDAFYAACADYVAWHDAGTKDAKNVFPFGDGTAAAYAAYTAVRAKIDDYFGRCRLAAFDPRALAAVNREQEAYIAAAAKDLTISVDEIADFPIAIVAAGAPLPLAKGVNPAWADRIAALRAACCGGKDALGEAEWQQLGARFAGYAAWLAAKAGASVEPLGIDRVRQILAGGERQTLEAAIQEDLAVAPQVDGMVQVEKLARLHKSFAQLLNNYVSFTDFYARRDAIFQAGTLYLDGRACEMCFHVQDAGKHAKLAPMANTFLAYVDCRRAGGQKMTAACAFTAGDSDNLFEGRNGIFIDRKGQDWDATITKIVSNPISVRQAFWSPYKKVVRSIQEVVAKRAAAADEAATKKLAAGAEAAGEAAAKGAPPKPRFEIGTIAALGVAVGGISTALAGLLSGFLGLGEWIPVAILGLVLAISGPSMFIAWMKLQARNLGPILDANGWAVNTLTRINVPLGTSLTDLPRIPPGSHRSLVDPYAPKKSIWPRLLFVLLLLAGVGYGLYRTNLLHKWLPDWVPAHHTELGLSADPVTGAPGDAIVFTVRSTAGELQVADVSDTNAPVGLPALPVADGKATLTIPADAKPGTWRVTDAVGGTSVEITVSEKKQ